MLPLCPAGLTPDHPLICLTCEDLAKTSAEIAALALVKVNAAHMEHAKIQNKAQICSILNALSTRQNTDRIVLFGIPEKDVS